MFEQTPKTVLNWNQSLLYITEIFCVFILLISISFALIGIVSIYENTHRDRIQSAKMPLNIIHNIIYVRPSSRRKRWPTNSYVYVDKILYVLQLCAMCCFSIIYRIEYPFSFPYNIRYSKYTTKFFSICCSANRIERTEANKITIRKLSNTI